MTNFTYPIHKAYLPSILLLAATIRTTSTATRELVEERIRTIIGKIVESHGATYELDYIKSYPAIMNDPELINLLIICQALLKVCSSAPNSVNYT